MSLARFPFRRLSLPVERPALCAQRIVAGYGPHMILDKASITVAAGEIVALVGHNGAGKSTLLKCIFGLLPMAAGSIAIGETDVRKPSPAAMLALGVALAPQGNRVLPDLSVDEHLRLASLTIADRAQRRRSTDEALSEFHILKALRHRKGGTLSGGEKQMLVIAAALVTSPRLLLLDEPTLGLSPAVSDQVLQRIAELRHERGLSLLIAEQRVQEIVAVADRVCVMRRGTIAFDARTAEVRNDFNAFTSALF
jgi:branched-chain amino acid transport system ATP-binding protein